MEENKYSRGKIYKIVSQTNDDIYIGSTCEKYLSKRLGDHACHFRDFVEKDKGTYCSSHEIIKNGDYSIILLEAYPCNSKDELRAREREWQESTSCVNLYKAHRSKEQKDEYNKTRWKKWYEANKDNEDRKEYNKELSKNWREENKQYKKLCDKNYYEANKDRIKEAMDDEDKEKLRQKNRDYYVNVRSVEVLCEVCSCYVKKGGIPKHNKTQKHINNSEK